MTAFLRYGKNALQRRHCLVDRVTRFAYLTRGQDYGVRRNIAMTRQIRAERCQRVQNSACLDDGLFGRIHLRCATAG